MFIIYCLMLILLIYIYIFVVITQCVYFWKKKIIINNNNNNNIYKYILPVDIYKPIIIFNLYFIFCYYIYILFNEKKNVKLNVDLTIGFINNK